MGVRDRVKVRFQIRVYHPPLALLDDALAQRVQSVVSRPSGPEAVRAWQKVRLVDWLQQHQDCPLRHLVFERRNAERSSRAVRLGDVVASHRRRKVAARLHPAQEVVKIGLQVLLVVASPSPSMPVAPSLRVRRYASRIHSPSIRWCRDVNTRSGCSLACSAIHCCFVYVLVELRVSSSVSHQSDIRVGGQRRHGPPQQAGRLGLREVGVLLDGIAPVRLGDPEGVEYGLGAQESRGDRQRRHTVGMEVGGHRVGEPDAMGATPAVPIVKELSVLSHMGIAPASARSELHQLIGDCCFVFRPCRAVRAVIGQGIRDQAQWPPCACAEDLR